MYHMGVLVVVGLCVPGAFRDHQYWSHDNIGEIYLTQKLPASVRYESPRNYALLTYTPTHRVCHPPSVEREAERLLQISKLPPCGNVRRIHYTHHQLLPCGWNLGLLDRITVREVSCFHVLANRSHGID